MNPRRRLKAGDRIIIDDGDEDGRQEVVIIGFQAGTGDMVIDDGKGDLGSERFCGRESIIWDDTP